jgi:hypothetical protein
MVGTEQLRYVEIYHGRSVRLRAANVKKQLPRYRRARPRPRPRQQMRKQGSRTGEGWSEENLPVTVRTNLVDGNQWLGCGDDYADFYGGDFGRLQSLCECVGIGRRD